jgi:radical SAM superfamily enzyme YgiQ (UPF0313 family)
MVVDLRREVQSLGDLISQFQPDIILVSLNWGRDEYVDKVIAGLPPETTLMVGGIQPTRYPEEYLAAYPQLDLLAIGYGEKPVTELLLSGSPQGVRGLWYRNRPKAFSPDRRNTLSSGTTNGELIRNEFRFDPDVSYFHIDRSLRRYDYPFISLKGDNIATSIGCPMACAFCGWRTNIYGELQKWIARPAEDVVDEIAEIDADIVHIVDANFAHDAERVEEICDLLIRRDIRRLLFCEIRVNALARSAELVKKMEQAGFFMFMVGIESADDTILKRLRKGYTVKMCRKAFRHLAKTDIVTLGNFLIGVPGQTIDDMLYVAEYAKELGLDLISPNKLYAYPNSTFRDWVLQHPDYRIVGRRHYVVSDEISLYRLRQIQREILLRFCQFASIRRFYRKVMSHPMVIKIGRDKVRAALLRSVVYHLADPSWRKRSLKKAFGRFRHH